MANVSIQIMTKHPDKPNVLRIQEPAVEEGVTLEYSMTGSPTKLTFTCIKDRTAGEGGWDTNGLSFPEGAQVKLVYDGKDIFFGYVIEKSRNKEHHIEVTCYDRTFYFKNKENYVFTNVTLDQIIKRIADDWGFPIGSLTSSSYVIPKLAKRDSTIRDIIEYAIKLTTIGSGEEFVFYDEGGKLYLKKRDELELDLLIDKDTFEDFDYSSSIADNTYNQVVIKGSDEEEPYVRNNYESQKQFGVLQLVLDSQDGGNKIEKAKRILEMRQYVTRSFAVNGHFGDIRVRGGSGIWVDRSMMGDIEPKIEKMWVQTVTHTFNHNEHSMDMQLIDGKGFYGE